MLFEKLTEINRRPELFERYTVEKLWNDEYVSERMLELHLDGSIDLASRRPEFIDRSVGWMTSRFELGLGKSVCDLGCGPGLYSSRLAAIGAEVTGIDFSERSIAYAREAARDAKLEINYVLGNYLDYSSDNEFDLVIMIFCDLCTLSPDQRRCLFYKIHKCLKAGGSLLLDVISLNHFQVTEEKRTYEYSPGSGFWSREPYYVFQNTFKYEKEKVILDKYMVIERKRTWEIFNWLQCYSPDSLKGEIAEAGFRIIELYSNVAGEPFSPESLEIAVVAQKA